MAKTLCSGLFSFLLLGSVASAQVVIEMSSTTEGAANQMYVKNGMTRVNSQVGGNDASTIFRGEELLMLNHGSRTYNRFGREEVTQLSQQMNEARQQMEEQLADLPPSQRAMVEKMMGERMAMMGSAPEPLRVERGGSSQAGNYTCTEHTVYRGDEKTFEICAASVGELGPGAAEAREAFEAMAGFMEQLMQSFSQGPLAVMIETPFQAMPEIEGFPVRTRRFDGDQVTSETTLTSIRREAIDDALFSPPGDYEEQEMEGLSR